jgi:hypothetical protein
MYDYYLGGKDSFAVDRAVAAEAVKKMGDDDRPRRPRDVRGQHPRSLNPCGSSAVDRGRGG